MSVAPNTCRIYKGTTLEELANSFNLTKEQLKRYHNTYCPLHDLIGHDIPDHVTMIYVPPEDRELREKIFIPKDGNFINYKTKNTLDNKNSYQKRYGIIQKTLHNDEEKLKIHYEIEIKKNNFNVEVNRYLVYINHKRPDSIVEQMADKVGNIMFPLELELNENGTIKGTANQQEILNRLLKLKPELEDYYKGKEAEQIFQKVGKNLKSRSRFLHKIKDSIFYVMYFFPLYGSLNDNKKNIFQIDLPLDEYSGKVPFEITLSLDEVISETNIFFIRAEGKRLSPIQFGNIEDALNIINNESNKEDGYFDFTYKLNSKDNSIFAIYGEMGIKYSDFTKKITFECYEQS